LDDSYSYRDFLRWSGVRSAEAVRHKRVISMLDGKQWISEALQQEKNRDEGKFSRLYATVIAFFNFLGKSAIDLVNNLGAATIFFSNRSS